MGLKSFAEQTAHTLGAAHLLRALHSSRARILMYHRFPGSAGEVHANLTRQCEHLRRYYRPIGLTELATALQEHRPIPPGTIAITVDDGYADFAHAFPVFQSFGLKVTLYAVSGFASRELWLWPDRVQYLLDNTTVKSLTIPLPGSNPIVIDTSSPLSRQQAFQAICQPLIRAGNDHRLRTLEALPALFETQIPSEIPDQFAPLSWEHLRAMAAEGLDIGCHTNSHPILSKLHNHAELQAETAGAKQRLEQMLHQPVHHFCYPNGGAPDFNEASILAVRSAGFQTAVVTKSGLVTPDTDVFQLPRLGVEPEFPQLYFERFVAGHRV